LQFSGQGAAGGEHCQLLRIHAAIRRPRANDFGAQEPGSSREIANFCEINYGVSFPVFAKSGVSAGNANPFYAALAAKTGERPQWNFHKYLIDRSGDKVLSFRSAVAPEDRKLTEAIERMLAAPQP